MECPILSCSARPKTILYSPHEKRLWLIRHMAAEHHRVVFIDGPEIQEAETQENQETDAEFEHRPT